MTTVKDVAKLAGVSASTVSRSLSEKIFVDPQTKARVLLAVEKLKYRPNLMAKGLKEGITRTFALIIPSITNLYYPQLVHSVEKCAAENDYSLILYNTNEDLEAERKAVEALQKYYVAGVIVSTASNDIQHILALEKNNIPFVLLNRLFPGNVNYVSNDQALGARKVMGYLIQKGHKRISVLLCGFQKQIYKYRYDGCMAALRAHRLEASEKFFLFDVNGIDVAHRRVIEIMRRKKPPTALFVTNNMLAFGVYRALNELGLRIPADVSIIGYDNLLTDQYMNPPLTSYEQPLDEIGKHAVLNLISQIKNKLRKPEKLLLSGSLLERESVQQLK
ncbi:MAG: LacI family transcriptional regulator [Spirochaetales bacterium]|jgi:DNA-binding LacI/PurR family transcriptional regulator|nr:LacI family transcriptional regulator [Spirochaetales bacterium]